MSRAVQNVKHIGAQGPRILLEPFRNESWRGCAVIEMGFAMASQVSHTIHRYIYLQEWLIFIGWWR